MSYLTRAKAIGDPEEVYAEAIESIQEWCRELQEELDPDPSDELEAAIMHGPPEALAAIVWASGMIPQKGFRNVLAKIFLAIEAEARADERRDDRTDPKEMKKLRTLARVAWEHFRLISSTVDAIEVDPRADVLERIKERAEISARIIEGVVGMETLRGDPRADQDDEETDSD